MIRLFITVALLGVSYSFMKGNKSALRYFEVGTKSKPTEWRDTSFVVATSNPRLISVIEAQLKMPIAKRNMITGKLSSGNGGYNKNGSYEFNWHYNENEWGFAQKSMELCDGKPYTDVDRHIEYWLNCDRNYTPI
jgi:hypothetical protein